MVDGFAPSHNAFLFPNSWAHVPAFTVDVAGVSVPIGDAARGLCGGMAYAVRDYFEAGRPVPTDSSTPSSGPLYEFIGRRLKDSFDLPLGPATYMELMAAPDGDKSIPILGWILGRRRRGIASRTVSELQTICGEIDSGRLSCLGLVCTRGSNPLDLGKNHQVLAYRYEVTGDLTSVWVYDPNRPGRDDVYLRLSTGHPASPTPIDFVNGSEDVRGFFRTTYRPASPPA